MSARPKSSSSRRVQKDTKKEKGYVTKGPEESPSKSSVASYHTTSEESEDEEKKEQGYGNWSEGSHRG